MPVFNRLKNMKSIRHNNKEIVAVYANNKMVYQKDSNNSGGVDIEIDPNYNYFVFDTSFSTATSPKVSFVNYYATDGTSSSLPITDWGDGTVDTELSHTYASHGIYTVKTQYAINNQYSGNQSTRDMLIKCLNINQNIQSAYMFFSKCTNLQSVKAYGDSKITTTEDMFNQCPSLVSVDFSQCTTNHITTTEYMFYDCGALTSVKIPNLVTGATTNIKGMLCKCVSLTSLDLSGWTTTNVSNMNGLLWQCKSLASVNVRGWDMQSVTDIGSIFSECESLVSLDLSDWSPSGKLTDVRGMFSMCTSLEFIDMSNFNMSSEAYTASMFSHCDALTLENIILTNCHETVANIITDVFNTRLI